MSTQEVITEIQSMSLKERLTIIEATLKLITDDISLLGKSNKELDYIEKVRQRRRNFTIKPFDLGEDLTVDRDLIYSERGI
jgi:hypothetical protein